MGGCWMGLGVGASTKSVASEHRRLDVLAGAGQELEFTHP